MPFQNHLGLKSEGENGASLSPLCERDQKGRKRSRLHLSNRAPDSPSHQALEISYPKFLIKAESYLEQTMSLFEKTRAEKNRLKLGVVHVYLGH